MELAFQAAGEHDRYQKIMAIIIIATAALTLILPVSFAYLTKIPGFLCRNPDDININYYECDFNNNFCLLPKTIDFIKDPNPQRSINNFAYSFDLYCAKEFYSPMLSSFFFFGGILGCVFLSSIPDKYGRKIIFISLLIGSSFMHLNILFAINPQHLLIIHFLSGICSFAYGMSSVLVAEYIPRNLSNLIMSFTNAIYPLSGITVGFYFLIINNWRLLFLFTTILQFSVTYLAIKYFKESPKWLNSQKMIDKCINNLREIANINGKLKTFDEYIEKNKELLTLNNENSDNQSKQPVSYSLLQIFNFPSQRKNSILNFIVWFSCGFCFYGIILNLAHLGGDFFADSILAFTGEITSELSSGWLSNIFGRIPILSGGGLMGSSFFLLYIWTENSFIKSISVFFATFGFAASFNVIFIYTPELFPTPIRATICGFSYLISRFGAMIVSPICSKIGTSANYLFVIMGIFMAFIFMQMEETLGKEMVDNIPEIEGLVSFVDNSNGFQTSNVKIDILSDVAEKTSGYFFDKKSSI